MGIVMVIAAWSQSSDLYSIALSKYKAGRNEKRKWCLENRKASHKTVSETTSIIRSQRDWKPS